jgi:hypothetical protein
MEISWTRIGPLHVKRNLQGLAKIYLTVTVFDTADLLCKGKACQMVDGQAVLFARGPSTPGHEGTKQNPQMSLRIRPENKQLAGRGQSCVGLAL